MKAKLVSLSGQQMKVEVGRIPPLVCDKCGEAVPDHNDAVRLDIELGAGPGLITAQPRHLLPTETCPGSPSRAQYLEGQPRDDRYPYDPQYEAAVRAAYARMQEATR